MESDFEHFSKFCLGVLLLVFCSNAYGIVVGTVFSKDTTAVAAAPAFVMPMLLFAGYITNLDETYDWLSWIQYLSPPRYACEYLCRNEFDDNDKYDFNPTETAYNLDFGATNCLVALIGLTCFVRLVSITALKISVM